MMKCRYPRQSSIIDFKLIFQGSVCDSQCCSWWSVLSWSRRQSTIQCWRRLIRRVGRSVWYIRGPGLPGRVPITMITRGTLNRFDSTEKLSCVHFCLTKDCVKISRIQSFRTKVRKSDLSLRFLLVLLTLTSCPDDFSLDWISWSQHLKCSPGTRANKKALFC